MPYQVGVDLGASHAAAAVSVAGRAGLPEIVPLAPRAPFVPSVVFVKPNGALLVGEAAERHALTDPSRLARQFKRRIGDGTPLRIGGAAMPAEELAARVVTHVLNTVAARMGGAASRVAVTHPAEWGPHRLTSLRAALAAHGLGGTLLLPEPVAAAMAYADRERLEPGAAMAVYDLGGGGFSATVVRKLDADRFTVVGQPEELELSGPDFDEVVLEHVRATVGPAWDVLDPTDPAVLAAVARLRRDCVAAKEALSADTGVVIPVRLPGIEAEVRLGRAEFEELIRPAVDDTVEALHRALGSAGIDPDDLAAVLLVGGSARIPLLTQEVSAQLGRPVSAGVDAKGIVAIGAALAARGTEPVTVALPAPGQPGQPGQPEQPGRSPAGDGAVPPAWTRPPPIEPPDLRIGRSWHRLVLPVAAGVLTVFMVAGGVALASRNGAGVGGSPGTTQTTTLTTVLTTVPTTADSTTVTTPESAETTTTRPPTTPSRTRRPNLPPKPPTSTTVTTTVTPTTTPTTSSATSTPTSTTGTTTTETAAGAGTSASPGAASDTTTTGAP